MSLNKYAPILNNEKTYDLNNTQYTSSTALATIPHKNITPNEITHRKSKLSKSLLQSNTIFREYTIHKIDSRIQKNTLLNQDIYMKYATHIKSYSDFLYNL